MPAFCDRRRTDSTSQNSVLPSLPSMARAPVDHLAIGLEMSSERNAPPKPNRADIPSRATRFRPFSVRMRSRPSTLAAMDSTIMIAMLVAISRNTRFIQSPC